MNATEQELDRIHTRCHATYFQDVDLLDDLGVDPMREYGRFDHQDFAARIYADGDADYIDHGGPPVRTFVFWSDGVANDWVQEVRDRTQAAEFLADLSRCCDRDDSVFTDDEAAKWTNWRTS